MWEETYHSPKAVLDKISQERLTELSEDDSFRAVFTAWSVPDKECKEFKRFFYDYSSIEDCK